MDLPPSHVWEIPTLGYLVRGGYSSTVEAEKVRYLLFSHFLPVTGLTQRATSVPGFNLRCKETAGAESGGRAEAARSRSWAAGGTVEVTAVCGQGWQHKR